jgi:hypothetical protein
LLDLTVDVPPYELSRDVGDGAGDVRHGPHLFKGNNGRRGRCGRLPNHDHAHASNRMEHSRIRQMVCGCSEGTYQRGWRWTATASTRTGARSGWARDTVVKGRLAPTAPKSVQHRDANMGMELPAQTKSGHIALRVCPPGAGGCLTACRSFGVVFASRTGSWQVQGKHKRGRGDTLRPRELVPTGAGLG